MQAMPTRGGKQYRGGEGERGRQTCIMLEVLQGNLLDRVILRDTGSGVLTH